MFERKKKDCLAAQAAIAAVLFRLATAALNQPIDAIANC
jgi:hypothetical protein